VSDAPAFERHPGLESNPWRKEIGREEALFRSADHGFPRETEAGMAVKDLCRKHGLALARASCDEQRQLPDQ
jgi:hypothetical protein